SYFESDKYQSYASTDGGVDPTTYEVGTNLTLTPFLHGLVGYWPLNEGSGTTAYDESGWGNEGTIYNSPLWISGISGGKALFFTTSTQYITTSGMSGIPVNANTQQITYTAWEKTTSTLVMGSIASVGYKNNFDINRGADQLFLHECSGGDTPFNANSSINIDDGNWHFVAISYFYGNGANKLIGEVDGSSATIIANGQPHNGSGVGVAFDQCNTNWGFPNGGLSKVRIYNAALTAGQLQAIYNAEKP
ncbi:MAG: LamG domain-containing protein, partial [Patescibacteria group bacterium]|nr:LamG domain-containing protein [Patescibacteria group bacterium]